MALRDEEQFQARGNAGSPPQLTHWHHFHAHGQNTGSWDGNQIGGKTRAWPTACSNSTWDCLWFSKLFNLYASAEKGRSLSKWTADFHGFRPQESDRHELQNEEALQLWLTTHQWEKSNFSPPMADAPVWETKAGASAHETNQTDSNLARLFVFCRSCTPPSHTHTPPGNVLLAPVLFQPETWQVVTVQRRVIHSKHTTGSGDWKSQ